LAEFINKINRLYACEKFRGAGFFGKPSRFAKEKKTRGIASLQGSNRCYASQTLAILTGLPKKKRREVSRLYKDIIDVMHFKLWHS
jgi:hypothetical protein